MDRMDTGANGLGISNPFSGIAVALVLAFIVSGGATFIALIASTPVPAPTPANNTGPNNNDGEIVLLDTVTGKDVPMGIDIPGADLTGVKLDLTGDIVTFYSNGEFKTFDIGAMKAKDEFIPSGYDPAMDAYKSNGHYLAVYSNADNSLTVRETVAQGTGHPESSVPIPSSRGLVRNMTADGDSFYWAALNGSGYGSVIYKYNRMTNTTSMVRNVRDRVTDLAAGGGRLAYGYQVYGSSYITMVDTASGRAWTVCSQCVKPRISGSIFAAVAHGNILVQNTTNGKRSDIKEDRQVVDLRVDGDRVAWSWFQKVDPITVMDLGTGKTYTFQPNHTVYTFSMSGDRLLMLRSKATLSTPIVPRQVTINPTLQFAMALTGALMFGAFFMGGMATVLESHRREERRLALEGQWAEYWKKIYEQDLSGGMGGSDGQWTYEQAYDRQKYQW